MKFQPTKKIYTDDGYLYIERKHLVTNFGSFVNKFGQDITEGITKIPNVTSDFLADINIFMESGVVTISEINLIKWIKYAELDEILEIKDFCIEYMETTLNKDTMWRFWNIARNYLL